MFNEEDKSLLQSLSMINSKLSFKNDPKWLQLDTTVRVLIYSLIQHINTCVNLINAQQYVIDDSTTAGVLYNGIYVTHPFTNTNNYNDEISDNDFTNIAIVFKNEMDKNQKLGMYSQSVQDPRLCMFEFVHYLYIPVRVDISTLSYDIKINSLRKYLTVIMFLPYMTQYTDRYVSAINNLEFMQKVHDTLSNKNNNIAQQMMTMKPEFIYKSLQTSYTITNNMMVYLRVYTNIIILISIEIMKKWCPNIAECMRINPDFDGNWINPFDTIVNEQIGYVQDITKITKTEIMNK